MDRLSGITTEKIKRCFSTPITIGEINAALSLIMEHGKGGVLELTPKVCAKLKAKHPLAQPAAPEELLSGEPPIVNPVLFEGLIGIMIRKTALGT